VSDLKILFVAAARPNFMKVAPMLKVLKHQYPHITALLVHTGQHYDPNMSDTFFEQLGIPMPDVNLGIGKGTHSEQTGQTMIAFEAYLTQVRPDAIVVVGDVNATMACAIVGTKMGIMVAHVEAGLRSFDRGMPEEINRLLTDAIADVLYTPSEDADLQLAKEGVDPGRVVLVGNVMIDTLLDQRDKAVQLGYAQSLGLKEKEYAVVTLHRPSNVDDAAVFSGILDALDEIKKIYTLIFPVHPRTVAKLKAFGLEHRINTHGILLHQLNVIPPLGYLEMLSLVTSSVLVVTDSGGLQEETTALQVPCITVRENTERPITVSEGTNILAGVTTAGVIAAFHEMQKSPKLGRLPKYWDGKAAERILSDLVMRIS